MVNTSVSQLHNQHDIPPNSFTHAPQSINTFLIFLPCKLRGSRFWLTPLHAHTHIHAPHLNHVLCFCLPAAESCALFPPLVHYYRLQRTQLQQRLCAHTHTHTHTRTHTHTPQLSHQPLLPLADFIHRYSLQSSLLQQHPSTHTHSHTHTHAPQLGHQPLLPLADFIHRYSLQSSLLQQHPSTHSHSHTHTHAPQLGHQPLLLLADFIHRYSLQSTLLQQHPSTHTHSHSHTHAPQLCHQPLLLLAHFAHRYSLQSTLLQQHPFHTHSHSHTHHNSVTSLCFCLPISPTATVCKALCCSNTLSHTLSLTHAPQLCHQPLLLLAHFAHRYNLQSSLLQQHPSTHTLTHTLIHTHLNSVTSLCFRLPILPTAGICALF